MRHDVDLERGRPGLLGAVEPDADGRAGIRKEDVDLPEVRAGGSNERLDTRLTRGVARDRGSTDEVRRFLRGIGIEVFSTIQQIQGFLESKARGAAMGIKPIWVLQKVSANSASAAADAVAAAERR